MLKNIVAISALTSALLLVGCGGSSSSDNGTSSSSASNSSNANSSSSVSSTSSSSSSSAISSVASSSSVSSSSSSSSAISDVNLTNACAYDSVYIAIYMNMNDTMLQYEKNFWGDDYTKLEVTALCTDYGFPATPDSEDSSDMVTKNYSLPATGYGNSILCNEIDFAPTTSAGNNNLVVYKVTGDGTNQCTSASSSSSVSSASSSSASSEPSIVDTSKLFLPDQELCEAGNGMYVAGACYANWSDANTMCQLLSKAQFEKIITDCGGSTNIVDQIKNANNSSYQDCYKSYGLIALSNYWSTTAGATAGTRYVTLFNSGVISEYDETGYRNVLCVDVQ